MGNRYYILIILLMLYAASISGQHKIDSDSNVIGSYFHNGERKQWILTLYKNHRFIELNYGGWLCRAQYGNWELKKNKIVLQYFRTPKLKKSRYIQNYCLSENISDSVFIYVYNYLHKPICNNEADLYLIKGNKQNLAQNLNNNIYRIHKNELINKLEFYVTGYPGIEISFKEKNGNCIHLFLAREDRLDFKKEKYIIENDIIHVNEYVKLSKR